MPLSSLKACDGSSLEGTLRDGVYIRTMPSSYSKHQLAQYLTRIRYAQTESMAFDLVKTGSFETNLSNLERLIRLHLLTFPNENTVFHYTPEIIADSEPQKLFCRLMQKQKGAFCAAHNILFLHVLRGLGYRAYHAAARGNLDLVANPRKFNAIDHLVILVQPQDSNLTYAVDVGSHVGPIRPILLSDSTNNFVYGTSFSEKFRLKRYPDPRSSLESPKGCKNAINSIWHLQVQRLKEHTQTASWITLYEFSEEEFHERDVASGSFLSRFHLDAKPLVHEVFAAKYILLDQKGNPILDMKKAGSMLVNSDILELDVGRAVLVGQKLKLIYGGESKLVTMLETEKARLRALKDVFGLIINDEEMRHIRSSLSGLDKDDLRSVLDQKTKL